MLTRTTDSTDTRFVHQTPLGPMTSRWTERGLYSLRWEQTSEVISGTVPSDRTAWSRCLDDHLCEYFATGRTDFDSVLLDSQGWTSFTEQVYLQCRAISPGTTITYKDLATGVGSRGASRAVGAAMSRNRILLVIPCHRVVSAGGVLRGFSAPGGLRTKQFLLDLESR